MAEAVSQQAPYPGDRQRLGDVVATYRWRRDFRLSLAQAAMLCKPYLFKQVLDQSMHFCTAQAS
jgi:hypothetical protein